MANTNFVSNTASYSPGEDLINIINRNSILGFLVFSNNGQVSGFFPLTNSISSFNSVYNGVITGGGLNQLYIVTGSQVNYIYNDVNVGIYLMPNCGVKIYVSANYTGACQLEAYNNTTQIVVLATIGGSNSSVEMFRNVGSFNSTGKNGYLAVS